MFLPVLLFLQQTLVRHQCCTWNAITLLTLLWQQQRSSLVVFYLCRAVDKGDCLKAHWRTRGFFWWKQVGSSNDPLREQDWPCINSGLRLESTLHSPADSSGPCGTDGKDWDLIWPGKNIVWILMFHVSSMSWTLKRLNWHDSACPCSRVT